MAERAQLREALNDTAGVQVTAVSRTSLRMKSWLPEYGAKSVVLCGRALPSQVGAVLTEPMRVLCLGPGEWLIVSREQPASSLRGCIERDLPRQGLALIDLTDGLATLEIRGTAARDLLSKGTGLDLHPRSFPAERCARTRFAQIPLVIECLAEPPRFELTVERSHVHYLHSWLTDAAVEFRCLEAPPEGDAAAQESSP